MMSFADYAQLFKTLCLESSKRPLFPRIAYLQPAVILSHIRAGRCAPGSRDDVFLGRQLAFRGEFTGQDRRIPDGHPGGVQAASDTCARIP